VLVVLADSNRRSNLYSDIHAMCTSRITVMMGKFDGESVVVNITSDVISHKSASHELSM
jgi:hypothetical protein